MIRGPSDFRVAPESAMLRGPSDFRASGHPYQVAWRLLTLSALSRRPIGRTAVPHDDQILYIFRSNSTFLFNSTMTVSRKSSSFFDSASQTTHAASAIPR